MLPTRFAFVDVETTGLSVTRDRIIEIGILRVENGKVVDKLNSLINPQMYVSPMIEGLTGISKQALDDAPTFDEMLHEIQEMLANCVLVAHNARFDYGLIKNEYKRFGFSFHAKCLCTAKLSRMLFPTMPRHNLDALIEHFDLQCTNRHRAFDDAKVLYDFFQKLQKDIPENLLVSACDRLLQKSSLPSHIDAEQVATIPEAPGVYLFYGDGTIPLYVGKSVNLKDRVLSHFTNDHASTKEMNLCQQVKRIETIVCNGELEALLKESQLIKTLLPIYNRVARISRRLVLVKTRENKQGYTETFLEETHETLTPGELDTVVGVFSSKRKAKDFLLHAVSEQKLCEKLVGLEKTKGACFQYRLNNCHGACVGKENPLMYNARCIIAFSKNKIKPWPFNGPIAIKETSEQKEEPTVLMVNKWCLVEQDSQEMQFDMDTYKILYRYLNDQRNYRNITLLHLVSRQ